MAPVRVGNDMNDLPRHADVVFVGADHNALVAAAYLLEAGRSVVLLDQMAQPGGWVRTAELGAAGFHHDLWSALHPAFVSGPAWAELGPDLKRHGLDYVTAPLATGSSRPGGRTATPPVDQQAWPIGIACRPPEESVARPDPDRTRPIDLDLRNQWSRPYEPLVSARIQHAVGKRREIT